MHRSLLTLCAVLVAGCDLTDLADLAPAVAPQNALPSLAEEFSKNRPVEPEGHAPTAADWKFENQLESYLDGIVFLAGREQLVDILRNQLRGENRAYQLLAATALIRRDTDTKQALQVLIDALCDADESIAGSAAHALTRLTPASLPAVPALAEATTRSDEAAHGAAIAIAQFGETAVPHLIKALEKQDPASRWMVSYALSEIGEVAVPALIESLRDERWHVRLGAVSAVAEIGLEANAAAEALIPLLTDAEPKIRAETVVALQRINARSAEAISALIITTRDPELPVRSATAVALGVLGEYDRVGPALLEMTRDPSARIRANAVIGLKELGRTNEVLLQRLIELLADDDEVVRLATVATLAHSGPAAKIGWPQLAETIKKTKGTEQQEIAKLMSYLDPAAATREGITWDAQQEQFIVEPNNSHSD